MAVAANFGKISAMRARAVIPAFVSIAAAAAALASACEDTSKLDDQADGGDADTDTDADTDADADGGADSGCASYPAGPYDWDLDEVVSMETFPAIYGSGGEPTVLEMCRVFAEADEVKSVVFVIGTTTCAYCPERFTEIGGLALEAYGAEKAAVYYNVETDNANLDPAETSDIVDTYGWDGGWRISDTEEQAIFYGGYPDWLWMATPNVFILDAHAMVIVAAEKGETPAQIDVLAEVQAIDEMYP